MTDGWAPLLVCVLQYIHTQHLFGIRRLGRHLKLPLTTLFYDSSCLFDDEIDSISALLGTPPCLFLLRTKKRSLQSIPSLANPGGWDSRSLVPKRVPWDIPILAVEDCGLRAYGIVCRQVGTYNATCLLTQRTKSTYRRCNWLEGGQVMPVLKNGGIVGLSPRFEAWHHTTKTLLGVLHSGSVNPSLLGTQVSCLLTCQVLLTTTYICRALLQVPR